MRISCKIDPSDDSDDTELILSDERTNDNYRTIDIGKREYSIKKKELETFCRAFLATLT